MSSETPKNPQPKVLILYNQVDEHEFDNDIELSELTPIKLELQSMGYQVAIHNLDDEVDRIGDAVVVHRPSLVLNLIDHVYGDSTHLASLFGMLDLYGYVYTGSDPLCVAACRDRSRTLVVLRDAGLPTPKFSILRDINSIPKIQTSNKLMVSQAQDDIYDDEDDRELFDSLTELQTGIHELAGDYDMPFIVEEYVQGRRLQSIVLGNQALEVLPLTESLNDTELDEDESDEEFKLAQLPLDVVDQIRLISRRAFKACGCRDIAQFDFAFDGDQLVLINIRPIVDLMTGPFPLAASSTAPGLLGTIGQLVQHSHKRLPSADMAQHPLPSPRQDFNDSGIVQAIQNDVITEKYTLNS